MSGRIFDIGIDIDGARAWRWTLMVTGAMAVLRIAALFLTPLQLYPDEAQYWLWSRDLAAGYVSKPPVIAWLIAASTALGGDSEAWIRLPAVLCHAGAALVLYRVGRRLYGPAVGLLASLLWTLAPGILVSAAFIATDAPLALFLSLGLWGYAVLLTRAAGEGDRGAVEGASRCTDQTPAATAQSRPLHHPSGGPPPPYASLRVRSWPLAAALGASLGLAFLSKQAAIYFLGGLILHALTSREARAAWRGWAWAVTLAVFALVISPNIAWQATHHFATVAHTTEVNGHFGSSGLKPLDMLGFVAGQFGVLGPVPFGALLVGLVIYARRRSLSSEDLALVCLALPPLLIVTLLALVSKGRAHWAAAGYPAAMVLIAAWLVRWRARRWTLAGLALQAAVAAVFLAAVAFPAIVDWLGQSRRFDRLRAWDKTAAQVAAAASTNGPVQAVLVEDRYLFNELAYYGRAHFDAPAAPPLRFRPPDAGPLNQAELAAPLERARSARVLVVEDAKAKAPLRLPGEFTRLRFLGRRSAEQSPGRTRSIDLYLGEGYLRPARP